MVAYIREGQGTVLKLSAPGMIEVLYKKSNLPFSRKDRKRRSNSINDFLILNRLRRAAWHTNRHYWVTTIISKMIGTKSSSRM